MNHLDLVVALFEARNNIEIKKVINHQREEFLQATKTPEQAFNFFTLVLHNSIKNKKNLPFDLFAEKYFYQLKSIGKYNHFRNWMTVLEDERNITEWLTKLHFLGLNINDKNKNNENIFFCFLKTYHSNLYDIDDRDTISIINTFIDLDTEVIIANKKQEQTFEFILQLNDKILEEVLEPILTASSNKISTELYEKMLQRLLNMKRNSTLLPMAFNYFCDNEEKDKIENIYTQLEQQKQKYSKHYQENLHSISSLIKKKFHQEEIQKSTKPNKSKLDTTIKYITNIKII